MHFIVCSPTNSAMSDAATQILLGNAAFTNKLYQILAKKSGNVFFSPLSLHAALAMLFQSAQNETAEKMRSVLGIPDAETTAEGYKLLIDKLKSIENVILYMANKIYVKEKVKFLDEFETSVRECFYSELEALDFGNKTETVRKMNEWVTQKTAEKITEVVDKKFIEKDTTLFLLNVIYFKANWNEKFGQNQTTSQPFYLDDEKTIDVQMMKGRNWGFYRDDQELQAKILCLPYTGKRIEMMIILPNEKNGIQNLETKLAAIDFVEVINKDMDKVKANLSLPKFKFENSMDLENVVKEMGLGIIFDERHADFSKMLKGNDSLCIDKMLQKAYIDVNEEGSEAAAVTVVGVKRPIRRIKQVIVDFVVDHPAVFLLVEGRGENNNILFCGRLSCPKY